MHRPRGGHEFLKYLRQRQAAYCSMLRGDSMLVGGFLRDIVPVWNLQPFVPGLNINFRLGKASKPSKLNQAELEIVVMTPAAMATAANTVWLAPVDEKLMCVTKRNGGRMFRRLDLLRSRSKQVPLRKQNEELRGTQLEHDFL